MIFRDNDTPDVTPVEKAVIRIVVWGLLIVFSLILN